MSGSIPKTIKQKLGDVKARVEADPEFGRTLGDLSIIAILKGPTSTEWENYMKQIVGPNAPKQLARLTFNDLHSGQPYARKNSAYIVANGACGTQTGTNTNRGVGDDVDTELAPEP